jgi:primosomal replication protein N
MIPRTPQAPLSPLPLPGAAHPLPMPSPAGSGPAAPPAGSQPAPARNGTGPAGGRTGPAQGPSGPHARPAAPEEPVPPRLRPNRLLWRGTIETHPEVKRSGAGIDYCVLVVSQHVQDTQKRPVKQSLEVVLFRERAHDVARCFRKGDVVEVAGELRIRHRKDDSGAWHTNITLHPSEEIALIERPAGDGA